MAIQLDEVLVEAPKNGRGEVIRASVREFKGKRALDIREYYVGEDGTMKPGKGVWLPHGPAVAVMAALKAREAEILALLAS